MDNAELKSALLSGEPVILEGTDGSESEYECISAIIYRRKNGRIDISAEIFDYCGHSVSICDPKRLRLKGGGANVV